MFNFFDQIVDWFEVIFNMISNTLGAILDFFMILSSAIKVPFQLMPFVHPLVGTSILIVASIGIVKLLLPGGSN